MHVCEWSKVHVTGISQIAIHALTLSVEKNNVLFQNYINFFCRWSLSAFARYHMPLRNNYLDSRALTSLKSLTFTVGLLTPALNKHVSLFPSAKCVWLCLLRFRGVLWNLIIPCSWRVFQVLWGRHLEHPGTFLTYLRYLRTTLCPTSSRYKEMWELALHSASCAQAGWLHHNIPLPCIKCLSTYIYKVPIASHMQANHHYPGT